MKREGIIIVFAICCALFLLSSSAFAQVKAPVEAPKAPEKDPVWKVYLESEGKRYYFAPGTVRVLDNRKVEVWEKIAEKKGDGDVDTLKSLIQLDCSSSKYRVVATKEIDPATGQDKPEIRSENDPWQYFNLESILGVLYDNVCYRGGMKIPDTSKPAKPAKPAKEEKK